MQSLDKDKPNKFRIWLKENRKNELTLSKIVVRQSCSVHWSLIADSDRQTDEQGGHNLGEKGEKREKETSREIVVILKWNLWYALFILIIKYSNII